MAKDPAWATVLADSAKVGQFLDWTITVGIDL